MVELINVGGANQGLVNYDNTEYCKCKRCACVFLHAILNAYANNSDWSVLEWLPEGGIEGNNISSILYTLGELAENILPCMAGIISLAIASSFS